ncbi:cyclin-domain-containing protein [Halteromyces radiatus]|uniref:cyclin-domain-containing protein n=1 Tax=Halteromyces radiatus TaxID=101107 RepID=UPI0022203FC8|nr:cyclin-domain-containing protein [Halteromyces radiatus]KAI8084907.1 cyclin-domain-containing protein [Halteromyces radiatus]
MKMNHQLPSLSATPSAADLLTAPMNNLPYSQPQLLSLLMNSYMKQTISPSTLKPTAQDQQRTYVNALVDVTVQAIASIWPNSNAPSTRPIANLNTFLHHILKHSRTTHSTLQLAIFYLFRIRPKVQERHNDVYIACGRRMFLAALICAHKFLQDKTYKNSAWSKVSGLDVSEINHAEKVMLQLLDYQLYVKKDTYDQWVAMLQTHLHVPVPSPHSITTSSSLPSSLPSPTSSPSSTSSILSSSSPISTFVHSAVSSINSISTKATNISSSTAFMMGMPTPVEDQDSNISSSPVSSDQRKRKSSLDHGIKKRRC